MQTILVVDDDVEITTLLTEYLARFGYTTLAAGYAAAMRAQLAALPDHAQIIEGNCVEIVPEDLAIAETACTVASDAYPPVMQAAPGV